jgi:CDP-paratose 2-epimerase
MHVLVTGGAGFIGSHVAAFYAGRGDRVTVLDNLSRQKLLGKSEAHSLSNWNYLDELGGVTLVRGDVCDADVLDQVCPGAGLIVHCAAQTAVTTSIVRPDDDFSSNARGTFSLLEAARRHQVPAVIYCSTNKVYGDRVNRVPVEEGEHRYRFGGEHTYGITEEFGVDLCEHTPYGCSKLTGDLYMQDYAHIHGIRTGVFRMSCIYGERQMGVEDQGWLAWFTIAAMTGRPITLFGDGKQVRDVLYVGDLVQLFNRFAESGVPHTVCNAGGGPQNTLSLLELIGLLEQETGKRSPVSFAPWRPSDQKVYVSDIGKAARTFDWAPATAPREGVRRLVRWVGENLDLFDEI